MKRERNFGIEIRTTGVLATFGLIVAYCASGGTAEPQQLNAEGTDSRLQPTTEVLPSLPSFSGAVTPTAEVDADDYEWYCKIVVSGDRAWNLANSLVENG